MLTRTLLEISIPCTIPCHLRLARPRHRRGARRRRYKEQFPTMRSRAHPSPPPFVSSPPFQDTCTKPSRKLTYLPRCSGTTKTWKFYGSIRTGVAKWTRTFFLGCPSLNSCECTSHMETFVCSVAAHECPVIPLRLNAVCLISYFCYIIARPTFGWCGTGKCRLRCMVGHAIARHRVV